MSPEELWASKYAARHAEQRFKEEARREQAFLDLPAVVCGEELRVMTPMDWVVLNGIRSPFVCGGEAEAGDIGVFLWWLSLENDHSFSWFNERRKKRFIRRISALSFDASVEAIREHVDELFQDAPGGGSGEDKRPLGTCFIAPMVVKMAGETGWSEQAILATPLPRLLQYSKVIRARDLGSEFTDTAPSDVVTSDFLSELNQLINRN